MVFGFKEVNETPEKMETNEFYDRVEQFDTFDKKIEAFEKNKESKIENNADNKQSSFLGKIKSLFDKGELTEDVNEPKSGDSLKERHDHYVEKLRENVISNKELDENLENKKIDKKSDDSDAGWERERTREGDLER